ncbi:hypothetical protein O9993_11985 [Vibrio lentus]|nr:hypothetical protein [Vibrio lentus]
MGVNIEISKRLFIASTSDALEVVRLFAEESVANHHQEEIFLTVYSSDG